MTSKFSSDTPTSSAAMSMSMSMRTPGKKPPLSSSSASAATPVHVHASVHVPNSASSSSSSFSHQLSSFLNMSSNSLAGSMGSSQSLTQSYGNTNSATATTTTTNNSNNNRRYSKVEYMEESDRETLRQKALEEANAVMSNSDYIGNHHHHHDAHDNTNANGADGLMNGSINASGRPGRSGSNADASLNEPGSHSHRHRHSYSYLDNFNLLGVVTTPRTLDGSSYNSSHHGTKGGSASSTSPQRRGSSANDSNANGNGNGNVNGSSNVTSSNGSGNGVARTGSFGINTDAASSLLDFSQMSDTLSKEIQSLNTTIYSYSQSYLGLGPYTSSLEGFKTSAASGMILGGSGGGESKHYIGSSSTDFETELIMTRGRGRGGNTMTMYYNEDIPMSQRPLEDLPNELVHLDLTTVEAYLRKCGRLAQKMKSYDSNRDEDGKLKIEGMGSMGMGIGMGGTTSSHTEDDKVKKTGTSTDVDAEKEEEAEEEEDGTNDGGDDHEKSQIMEDDTLNDVPEIFFSQDFDLTNPKIFESLLVLKDGEEGDFDIGGDGNGDGDGDGTISGNSSISMTPVIQIQKPEKFTQHLDNIEIALLNQVRSKSDSFFRETNRFSYLKSLVADSVNEVTSLRAELDTIRERSINDAEMIPIMDRRRNDIRDLVEVLDEIGDVLEVKSSVAGLIAAGDYLGAVDAIHMARRLLNGEKVVSSSSGSVSGSGSGSEITTSNSDQEEAKEGAGVVGQESRHVLKKLTALNKVNDQLAQYENLVVMDLSNNLVGSFLSWNSNASSIGMSIATTATSSSSSIRNDECQNVKQTILAMKKCKRLSMVADIYREKLCDTIRVTIRTTVNECAADAAKDVSLLPSASATIVSLPDKDSSAGAGVGPPSSKASIIEGVTSMSFAQFMECLDMIYEHVLSLLRSAAGVNKFCLEEGISFKDEDVHNNDKTVEDTGRAESSNSLTALFAGADLAHRSISEILRLRKEAHSLISFEEMRRLWDSCLAFTLQIDKISGQKVYILRSTLLAQAKAFVERKHEANMSSIAAALDSERWTQCDVSRERQNTLDRLCSGRAVISSKRDSVAPEEEHASSPFANVEGKQYRVVWSCLLLIEMVMGNVACAAHFQNLATNVVGKVSELLRLFNLRATQLVLGAGAIHSSARLKSINAKHLALVTQCVGVVKSILPHIRAALMAQLPSKQHLLLTDLDKIKKEYAEHHDKVLSKFVSIIGGIVEHSLVSRISNTDFDQRSRLNGEKGAIECCPFLDGIITNTKKMYQVLISLLPNEDLMDAFSRIFAHLDTKIPKILLAADSDEKIPFSFPQSMDGKRRIIMEVEAMADTLNNLPDVRPWDFGAMKYLSRRLEVPLEDTKEINGVKDAETVHEDSEETKGNGDEGETDENAKADGPDDDKEIDSNVEGSVEHTEDNAKENASESEVEKGTPADDDNIVDSNDSEEKSPSETNNLTGEGEQEVLAEPENDATFAESETDKDTSANDENIVDSDDSEGKSSPETNNMTNEGEETQETGPTADSPTENDSSDD